MAKVEILSETDVKILIEYVKKMGFPSGWSDHSVENRVEKMEELLFFAFCMFKNINK
ncbi:MAG: hypothetical protein MR387_09155 [Phocaeicola plebeius]|nr:hypothetical protein [Phocaeicola plebeius]